MYNVSLTSYLQLLLIKVKRQLQSVADESVPSQDKWNCAFDIPLGCRHSCILMPSSVLQSKLHPESTYDIRFTAKLGKTPAVAQTPLKFFANE